MVDTITLRVNQSGKSMVSHILHEVVPIVGSDDYETPLNKIIRDRIKIKIPSLSYDDNNIVSCKANNGLCVLSLLKLPISVLLNAISKNNPKEMKVVIEDQETLLNRDRSNDTLSLMMQEARNRDTIRFNFESKFPFDEVTAFLNQYREATNKGWFLSSYDSKKKPSIDDQIEAFVVQFLNDKKLGYTEKEKPNTCKAIKVFVDLLKFIHIHRSVLSERQKIKFNETILEKIQYSISAKAKPSKRNIITQESIIKNIEKCQECFDLWPESY